MTGVRLFRSRRLGRTGTTRTTQEVGSGDIGEAKRTGMMMISLLRGDDGTMMMSHRGGRTT